MQSLSTNSSARFYRTAFKLLKFSSRLGYKNLMRLGRFIGRRIMQLDAEHSRIAAINLDMCQPILSPQQQREMLQQHFESLGMGIMEMALSWWGQDEQFNRLVQVKGLQNLQDAQNAGKGIILVTASFTSPEVLLRFIGQRITTTSFYHPHHNQFVDRCIQSYRKKHSEQVLTHEDFSKITSALKNNQALLIAHDADAHHKQVVFADFFKIPAATNTAVHRFARMTGATVVPVLAVRDTNDLGYSIIFESPLKDFPSNPENDTRRLNAIIERWIEKYPDQYDWSFARFRQRPPGEPVFY